MANINNEFEYQSKVFDKFLKSLFGDDEEEEGKEKKPVFKKDTEKDSEPDEETPLFI